MVHRWCWCGVLSLLAFSAAATPVARNEGGNGAFAPRPGNRARGFVPGGREQLPEMTPEEKARFDAARKRRYEIMILIESYKIMPEADRAALKRELLKRIEADLRIALEEKKQKLAAAEKELEAMRADIARREQNAAGVAEQELERLIRMPAPWRRGRGRQNGQAGSEAQRVPHEQRSTPARDAAGK